VRAGEGPTIADVEEGPQLRTERLLLRRWRPEDSEPFAKMNADAAVMEFFPAPLSRADSDAMLERIERCFEQHGYGLWAVEIAAERKLAGFTGLQPVERELAFAPAVELGWRLSAPCWGRGIATEAASAAAAFVFQALELPQLVAYTAAVNTRSRRVMERLAMRHDPAEDFSYPGLPAAHPLAAHVLYRLDADARR
jgi:RimJ/RimL family protein N-acetyltransferase